MSEEDVIINLKGARDKYKGWFIKYWYLILLIIPIILCAQIRLYSQELPATDEWSIQSVQNYYKNSIAQSVLKEYPNLPSTQLQQTVNEEYTAYYSQNKNTIDQQIQQVSQQYKTLYQDDKGYTYMPDIDPYAYLQGAENYLKYGFIGDKITNNTMWNTHMLAPNGVIISGDDPHPKVLARLYKVLHFFNANLTPMQSSTYFPIIAVCLSTLPIFFIGRKFAGNLGGFTSAMVFVVCPALFGRTSWGHADTDAYNILFPVYIIWMLFISLDAKDIKQRIIYSSLAGLIMGIFALFWSGWWFIFEFMVGGIVVYLLYLFVLKIKEDIKGKLITTGVFILSSFIVLLFTTPSVYSIYSSLILQPLSFIIIKSASHADLWPNVYTTVAELNPASIASIIGSVGGSLFFYGAIAGIVMLAFYQHRKYIYQAGLLALWMVGIMYATTSGIRFAMLLTPVIALGFGALIGILNEMLVKQDFLVLHKYKFILTIIIGILVCVVLIPQIRADYSQGKQDLPMMNDAWAKVLIDIKTNSSSNAIVNSWWDYGHYFKYYTDRAVTFDGASQNTPMAYWIGKTLLTNDENQARAILRMLDCGSNDAFYILNENINDTNKAVKLLNKIIMRSKENARKTLIAEGILNPDLILAKTHCNPPENYLITSGDMISKAGVWAHFGSWNFDKAEIWTDDKNLPQTTFINHVKEQLNITDEQATQLYYQVQSLGNEGNANSWISGWPGYGNTASCTKQDNNSTLNCGGVLIDIATKNVKSVASIVYIENKTFYEKKFEGNAEDVSIILRHNEDLDIYQITLCTPIIAPSLFTRLYYFDGVGLNNFKKFAEVQQPTGDVISVWNVNW